MDICLLSQERTAAQLCLLTELGCCLSVLHQTVSEDSLMNQTVSGNPLSAQRHCLFHPVYSGKVILYLYIDLSSAEASKNQIVLPIVIHESALHLDIKRFIFHA